MITTGLIFHTFPLSKLLFISSTLSLPYTLTIFNQVTNPSIFLYNTLISSFIKNTHHTHIAFSLYCKILSDKSLKPNNFTYPSLLKACGSHPWLCYGRTLHTHILKFLEPNYDHFVQASLLTFYSKFGKLAVCRYLFDQIPKPDLATWNSILAAYARSSNPNFVGSTNEDTSLSFETLLLFNEMQEESSVRPNEVTLVAVIGACADLGAYSQGAWAHAYVLKQNLELNHFVATALIELYTKCGCLELANQVFDQVPEKDTLCYNAMIGGFAIHGHSRKALGLFDRMRREGIRFDDVTILVVMCACAHVGLIDDGRKIFNSMKDEYRIEPKLEHYGCLVDLLGRAGELKEAEETLRTMPMKPNAVLWRSLLGASRMHGKLELGEFALKHLIELEPETSGNYVLLSNLYACMNRWDDVKRMRKMMKGKGVNKAPGSSLIEIGGSIHEFIRGDKTHPNSKEIHMKLEEIGCKLNTYGHKASTREVLFDIEEEEKEVALSYHSERLAIAFALIASCSSVPIRIIKNLRVCNDCHASTKLISKIYEREIIVRDRNRFHHFRYGNCSCSDYW
ncbi:Pentatricopeptide repeat-containing protein [Thalictrum thalictroides]|uniref:Pentatricopeptide repeat-containing protein n=1 Tax=Thalictrum thalictroides TaxID=46969 RepID=A0A7J6WP88_THATH|nr:Pentatricopeptide repeat-containing protein [Thalictrum thalictroides]